MRFTARPLHGRDRRLPEQDRGPALPPRRRARCGPIRERTPRSATVNANAAIWSTSKMVTPSSRSVARTSNNSLIIAGARPSEGSSSSSMRGFAISPRAIASNCCSPPERNPARLDSRSRSRGKRFNSASTSPSRSTFNRVYAPRRMLSKTVNSGKTCRPSGTSVKPLAAILCGRDLQFWCPAARWRRSPGAAGLSPPAWPSISPLRSRQAVRPSRRA